VQGDIDYKSVDKS